MRDTYSGQGLTAASLCMQGDFKSVDTASLVCSDLPEELQGLQSGSFWGCARLSCLPVSVSRGAHATCRFDVPALPPGRAGDAVDSSAVADAVLKEPMNSVSEHDCGRSDIPRRLSSLGSLLFLFGQPANVPPASLGPC